MNKEKLRKYREWNYYSIMLQYNKIKSTYFWYDRVKNNYNTTKLWEHSISEASSFLDYPLLDTPPKYWIDNYGNYRNALKYACKHYYSELITLENILRYTQFKDIERDIRNVKGIGEKYVEYYE